MTKGGYTHSGSMEKVNILNDKFTSLFTAEDTTNSPTISTSPFLDLEQIDKQPNRIKIKLASALNQTGRP